MTSEFREVSPALILAQVSAAIPIETRSNIIIIGSLAAAYWLFGGDRSLGVRTKDIDCVLSPRLTAVERGRVIAEKLLASGWKPKSMGRFSRPGNSKTPESELPAVRLFPPGSNDWFLELLTEPMKDQAKLGWTRMPLSTGEHYGIPSLAFISIAIFNAPMTEFGIRCARPEMMALANLLEHPIIGKELIEGTATKRSNKDLGRVLAIAQLTKPVEVLETWPEIWEKALKEYFPKRWRELASRTGAGLRALLASPEDLQQAVESCAISLLSGRNIDAEQLITIGQRLLVFAIDQLEIRAMQ